MSLSSNKQISLSCYIGYVVQAIINNLLPLFFVLLQDNYNISYSQLGSLVFINFISQLIVDLMSIHLIRLFGTKRLVLLAHAAASVGLFMLAFLPYVLPSAYLGLCISIITYALGSGLIEVLISPIIDKLESENKASSMSLLHSFYCWGQVATVLFTTLFIKLFGASWRLVPLVWVAIPVINFVLFARLDVPEVGNTKGAKRDGIAKKPTYYAFLLMMFCAGASEIGMSQWASTFAEKGLGISKVTGDLIGPCLFAVFMGTGRVLYGLFASRFNPYKIMAYSGVLGIICYLVAACSPSAYLSLAACAVCGLSVSILWPGVLSIASARFPSGGAFLFGTLAMAGDLGCAAGPWLIGAATDKGGFLAGFSFAAIFPLLMLICSATLYMKTKNKERVAI